MTLIHTALLCEAMPIIEHLKLQKSSKNIYTNENISLLVGGIGKQNTIYSLDEFFKTHKDITKAINIGIAGCSDKNINTGELFCTNKSLSHIPKASLRTVLEPATKIDTTLVDMEAEFFCQMCAKYGVDTLVLKVVSDHLDTKIPKKEFVSNLIKKSLSRWIKIL